MKIKIPNWIKAYWKDPVFRWFTFGLTLVPIAWDTLITFLDYLMKDIKEVHYATTVLGLAVLTIMYTIAYIRRNKP